MGQSHPPRGKFVKESRRLKCPEMPAALSLEDGPIRGMSGAWKVDSEGEKVRGLTLQPRMHDSIQEQERQPRRPRCMAGLHLCTLQVSASSAHVRQGLGWWPLTHQVTSSRLPHPVLSLISFISFFSPE